MKILPFVLKLILQPDFQFAVFAIVAEQDLVFENHFQRKFFVECMSKSVINSAVIIVEIALSTHVGICFNPEMRQIHSGFAV